MIVNLLLFACEKADNKNVPSDLIAGKTLVDTSFFNEFNKPKNVYDS